MPIVVDKSNIHKNKQIRCFKEAFKFALDSEYHKIVIFFSENPKEFFQFVTQLRMVGDSWAQELNKEWKGHEYFRDVFVKYLVIMMEKNDDKSRKFVEGLIDRKLIPKAVKVV